MEKELHERPLYRRFVGLEGAAWLPDETTILRFSKTPSPRHLLERHQIPFRGRRSEPDFLNCSMPLTCLEDGVQVSCPDLVEASCHEAVQVFCPYEASQEASRPLGVWRCLRGLVLDRSSPLGAS